MRRVRSPRRSRLDVLLCVGAPLVVLGLLGADRNWDLRNYHLYVPHAWLTGRRAIDVAPAQLQTWYNPLLDVPAYLLVRSGASAWVVGLFQTLPMMIALACLLRLHAQLAGDAVRPVGRVVVAALAITGAAATTATGSSFNDGWVAAAVLGALCLVTAPGAGARAWGLAGLLVGGISGLKLTAAAYAVALGAAAVARLPPRRGVAYAAAFGGGAALGFLACDGWWAWSLWVTHGNPVFPYLNQWFRSPDALPLSHADVRFVPSRLVDVLAIPFRLLASTTAHGELPLRDPRVLLGIGGLGVLAWRARRTITDDRGAALRGIAVVFVVAFLVWGGVSGIYRYVLPLEMLGVVLFVTALETSPWAGRPVLLAVVAGAVVATTQPPAFERSSFSRPLLEVAWPPLPDDSIVVIATTAPVGFAVATLPPTVPAVALVNFLMHPTRRTRLQEAAEARVVAHRGPRWLLRRPSPRDDAGEQLLQERYGLVRDGACRPVRTSFGPLQLCPLRG